MVIQEYLPTAMNAKMVGSGEHTVVLAHGYGADHSVWDKILPHLAQNYRVLVFDWCFSGAAKDPNLYDSIRYGSYDDFADDLIGLVDEMELKTTVFIGHSMSGMVGCIASIKRPDLFQRLLLVGATPRLANLEDYEGGFEMSEIDQIFFNIEHNYEKWTTSFASLVVDSTDPLSTQKFEHCLKRMRPEVALPLAKTVFLGDYRDILDKVIVPCDIIQTRNDIVVPNSVTEFMNSKIKGKHEVHIIDTDGHFPQLTAPLEFLEVFDRIMDF
ncbi:strigolactone esterase D14-like [Primulina eburnea]|uniref:strigolactone esterase D14-like n=1 Tax=Primulina eburnea TaxID=1245227 RepID=UPI003C6C28B8